MKNTRKFAAMIAALTLSACSIAPMAMTASAADETTGSISILNTATGHTYEAYQIFDGDLVDGVLSNIEWGTGINEKKISALETAVKAITLTDGTTPFANCKDASEIAKALSDAKVEHDAEITKKFASVVGDYLGTVTGTSEDTYSISGLDNGYYLVKDKDDTLNGADDAYTRYIVQVLGTKTDIAPKSAKPTVEKKVLENVKEVSGTPNNDPDTNKKWNDVADYNIGDAVPFKLYGTLPSATEYEEYNAYYYEFIDTLGTEFDAPEAEDITVSVNGMVVTDATGNMRISVTGNAINVSFENVKIVAPNATDIITVEYSAVLNKTANIGLDGQQNAVKLDYSNNPNEKYVPKTDDETHDKPEENGETPEDKVIVFTYEIDTTKVDLTDDTKILSDAEFLMQNADGKYATVDTDGIFTGWVDNEDDASTLISGADGVFKVIGIDDGTYTFIETKAPAGYDTPKGDAAKFTAVLKATTVNNQNWDDFVPENALTKLELNDVEKDATNHGVADWTIANGKGSELPSTGGIGTTIFYLGGGAMVAVAGVFLITKKRMGKSEN